MAEYRRTQKYGADAAGRLLQQYTSEEQLWILASSRAEYEKAEAGMQERRRAYSKVYGYWPDF